MDETIEGGVRPGRSQQLLTFFRNPEFLRVVGSLTPYNVVDYFSTSDFYERSCNNAVLQMQGGGAAGAAANAAAAAATAAGEGPADVQRAWEEKRNDPVLIEQELKRFVGLEYIVVLAKPPDLFVIHKRWRVSPTEAHVLEAYYVLQGNIHMAADLYTILESRMVSKPMHIRWETDVSQLSATSALGESLSLAREACPDFNAREGYTWRIAAENLDASDDDDDGKGSQRPVSSGQSPVLLETDVQAS